MSLKKDIDAGESKTIEFKVELPKNSKIAKTAIAFSNTGGGKLFIGIKDNGEVVGLSNFDILSLEDKVSQIIYDRCKPIINFEIYSENIDGEIILILQVFRGNDTPYYLKNKGIEEGTFVRIGATNRLADRTKIKELQLRSKNISFDEEINFEYNYEELDLKPLENEFHNIGKEINKEKLKNLKLIQEYNGEMKPTNGLLILLGIFENCIIRCSKFKGTDMNVFLDQKDYDRNVFNQMGSTLNFIKDHINLRGEISGLQREDKYEIPLIAIRESLVNAIVHRDYRNMGRDIKVGIYDDIVNIVSPGSFPSSLTQEDLLKGRSEIRNKVIARVFHELGYIEKWGSGIRKIIKSCNDYGLKAPEIEETGDSVNVNLYRTTEKTKIQRSGININFDIYDLNLREKEIIEYLIQNTKIKTKDVSEIFDLSLRRAREILNKMCKNNLIDKKGKSKNTHYVINRDYFIRK